MPTHIGSPYPLYLSLFTLAVLRPTPLYSRNSVSAFGLGFLSSFSYHRRFEWLLRDTCLTLIHLYRFFGQSRHPTSSDLTLSSGISIVAISMAKLNIGIFISLSSLCYSQGSFTCYCGRIASFTKPPAIFLLCFTSNFSAKSHHFSHCKAIMQHSSGCYGTFHSDQWRSWHNLPFFLMLGIKRVLHRYPWCCPMTAISSSNIKIDCITSKNLQI